MSCYGMHASPRQPASIPLCLFQFRPRHHLMRTRLLVPWPSLASTGELAGTGRCLGEGHFLTPVALCFAWAKEHVIKHFP